MRMYIKIVIFILSVLLMGCRDNVFDKILCDLETDSLNYASYLIINSSYIPIWKQKTNGYWVGPFYKGLLFRNYSAPLWA